MTPHTYRALLRRPDVRRLILVAMVARVPHSAAGLVLTFHIVETLNRSYTQAGAAVAVFTVGIGIGSPWRGRLVDRVGLRRALVPSIVAQSIAWPLVGFVPYWAVFPVVLAAGLLALPIFSVIRKALSVAVEPAGRRTAFALDSVCTELVFMVGPALGIWCATQVGAPVVLVVIGLATASSGVLLWRFNPSMSAADASASVDRKGAGRSWFTVQVGVMLAVSVAAAVALSGTDVGVLAQVRELGVPTALGIGYAVWCAASAVGGLVYGALHRPIDPVLLVLILGLSTAPLVLVDSVVSLVLLLAVAGLACAPVMVATTEALSHLVPEERRGEAMGWHGSAFTLGSAIGAPLAGMAIDRFGAAGGFGAVAVLAVLVAALGGLVQLRSRTHPTALSVSSQVDSGKVGV